MNANSTYQDIYDDGNLFGMRKITYWEIYGVKRFPYRGKRKYTPLLSQSLDGGMVISNDVFGLTISQFERVYTACLERRKRKEQWIINLRYPDKSSNEYLEYLQNCTDSDTDHLLWIENDPREKYLCENLVKIIGTEIDIRARQRLFILIDIFENALRTCNCTRISSGSLAEGLDLTGSDIDLMDLSSNEDVIQNVRNIKHPIQRPTLIMETDIDYPGFVRLRYVAIEQDQPCLVLSNGKTEEKIPEKLTKLKGKRLYASVNNFIDSHKEWIWNMPIFVHGPCLSDQQQTIDISFCLRSKYLPYSVIPWTSRNRRQWPPNFVIDRIKNYGCLFVPIGPKTLSDNDFLWRLSFSVAEKMLIHSFNFTQFLCYGLLKLTLKCIVNTNMYVKDLLCSYFLKMTLFWVSEEEDINTFQLSKLFHCFSLCLDKLISWVNICFCPNYFIPEQNMFLGKIDQSNNKVLLSVLESVQCGGIDGLITNLFKLDKTNHRLLSPRSGHSFIMLDYLFYRIITISQLPTDISKCYTVRTLTESVIKSESSLFTSGVCQYYHARASQLISQLLPHPNTIDNTYIIRKCYHRHLQDGTRRDATSGWLLYASFFYVTGQFNVTLKLTHYVLSRLSPDLAFSCQKQECEVHIHNYRQKLHHTMSLNDRMRIAIADDVTYLKHSSLIPQELQLEVEDDKFIIQSIVISTCLRFLCYHHIGNSFNRQQTLRDLSTISNCRSLRNCSNTFTILGVCYGISGHNDIAYHYYEKALQCEDVCRSAEKRMLKLLNG
ncbi:unnamed protein product [Mytilus coruscus]|uniref:Mab-21-like HhH/H2TH-like domain-containing protein n=1 Tax=Mytilus coruscus TaxID=42192 RepID=A0A6J8ET07_MYTCO|nr:unnamed protein product [Mytilus coruscus]